MQITYQRNMRQSFMIAESEGEVPEFEERMLRENEVRALLSFYTVCINRRLQFWYDITGKTSFRDYVEQEGLSADLIRDFFERLSRAFDSLARYLIVPERILLNPDTVFLERIPGDFRLFLCYMPLEKEGTESGLDTLTGFLTENTTGLDRALTEKVFRMYDVCLKERDAFAAVLSVIHDNAGERQQEEAHSVKEAYEEIQPRRPEPVEEEERRGRQKQQPEPVEDDIRHGRQKTMPVRVFEDNDPWLKDDIYGADDYAEDEEDCSDERGSLTERLKNKFFELLGAKKTKKHLSNLFPVGRKRPESLDFVYDKDDTIEEPTVLMSSGVESCSGRLVYEGDASEKDYVLSKDVFRIGSQADANDAVLHSPVVSRRHAKITRREGNFFIEDLNSKNGTYVNGKMLAYRETMRLKREDRIIFADVCYRLV